MLCQCGNVIDYVVFIDFIMSLDSIRNEIVTSAQREVASIQKVLKMQQQDNINQVGQIQLLEGELDGLKIILEKKQKQIVKQQDEIIKRDGKIIELEGELAEMRVTRSAIKQFADQNTMLMEKYEEQRKVKDSLEINLAKLTDETKDLKDISRIKAENLLKSEAGLITDLHNTNQKLISAMSAKKQAEEDVHIFKDRSVFLVNKLKESEDRRVNEVQRSRQSEYRTIQRTEELLEQLRVTESERDTIQDTLDRSTFRGDTLQDRLTVALKEVGSGKDHVIEAISKAEEIGATARLREKLLVKEIEDLRAELVKSQRVTKELFTSTRDMSIKLRSTEKELVNSRRFDSRNPGATRGYQPQRRKMGAESTKPTAAATVVDNINIKTMKKGKNSNKNQREGVSTLHMAATAPMKTQVPEPVSTSTSQPVSSDNMSKSVDFENPFAPRSSNLLSSVHEEVPTSSSTVSITKQHVSTPRDADADDEMNELGASDVDSNVDLFDVSSIATSAGALSVPDSQTGRFGMGVGGALDRYTDSNKPVPTPALDVRPDGRQRLLMHLVENFAAAHLAADGDNVVVEGLKADELNLANCGLLDADLLKMLDRLRYVPLSCVKRIDLRGNMITREGVEYLSAWLLGLKRSDYVRKTSIGAMSIDLRGNEVDGGDCHKTVFKLRAALPQRPEVKVVDVVDYKGRYVLCMYGPMQSDDDNEEAKTKASALVETQQSGALVKIDFGSDDPGTHYGASGTSQSSVTPKKKKIVPVKKETLKSKMYPKLPALTDDDPGVDSAAISLLIPRDDIINNYFPHTDQTKENLEKRGLTAPAGSKRSERMEELIRTYH